MSHRAHAKSRIKVCNKSVFHLQDKKSDEEILSKGLIKSAKRTGQLSLCNRGLGTGKYNVYNRFLLQFINRFYNRTRDKGSGHVHPINLKESHRFY